MVPDHVSDLMGKKERQGIVITVGKVHGSLRDYYHPARQGLREDLWCIKNIDLKNCPRPLP
jgi:hypothetical protein